MSKSERKPTVETRIPKRIGGLQAVRVLGAGPILDFGFRASDFPVSEVSGRRVSSAQGLFLPDSLGHRAVQLQRRYRGAPGRTEANDAASVPAEVQSPRIAAGIEQRRVPAGLRVRRCLPRAFAQRTRHARQRKIIHGGFAAGIDRDHMVNVKDGFLTDLRRAAVFTPVLRPLDHLTPKLRRDVPGLMTVGHSSGANAGARGRASQQVQPALWPHASQPGSERDPGPVCRGEAEAASARLWAIETGPGRPAFPFSVGWPETYSLSGSAAESIRQRRSCPSAEISEHNCSRTGLSALQ